MNRVEIAVSGIARPRWCARLAALARKTLAALGVEGCEVSILLCDDRTMMELNGKYRGKDSSTDVLSFRQNDAPTPGSDAAAGDVVICLEELERNARQRRIPPGEELARLTVHGILHLAGMDHGTGKSGAMIALQENLLKRLAGDAVFPARLRAGRNTGAGRPGMRGVRAIFFGVCLAALAASRAYCAQGALDLFQAGNRAQAEENYYQAISSYRASLDANPSYLAPMIGLAECFFYLEEYDEALRWADQAGKFDREDPALVVLKGRIFIGLGDLKKARARFSEVLSAQPNNLEARFGMAEADVAEGRILDARSAYEKSLALAPESRKALLALALLSEETGDAAGAAKYFDLVLRSHSDNPGVELEAGRWYAGRGDFESAEKRVKIALSLQPDLHAARLLLGTIYLRTGRMQEAIDAFRQEVTSDRDNALAWYGLGQAYAKVPDTEKALSSFGSAVAARPDDEVSRLSEEYGSIDWLKMDDPLRVKLGAFHIESGRLLEDANMQEKALAEYRRALLIDPTSRDARVAYARIFLDMGFPARYRNELLVLSSLGVKDTFVSDEIEAFTSKLADSLSNSWGVDQFALDRLKLSMPVFVNEPATRLIHAEAGGTLARYFADFLQGNQAVQVPSLEPASGDFESAFKAARERGTDFFLLLAVEESERSFSATAELYLSRTGALIASFPAFRTGNDRVRDCFLKITGAVKESLPLRGKLISRKLDVGLMDLGSFQGVKKEEVFAVLRRDKVGLDPKRPGLAYNDADVLGSFTVTATDEGVAEGLLERRGYFDYINIGDELVVPKREKAATPPEAEQKRGSILTRLFGIK